MAEFTTAVWVFVIDLLASLVLGLDPFSGTVPENGSSPKTRDASRSITKTQTAVVNSATSVFLGKSLVSAFWPNTATG